MTRGLRVDRAATAVARVLQAHQDHSMRDLSMHLQHPRALHHGACGGDSITTPFTWVRLPQQSIVRRYCCQAGQPPIADLRCSYYHAT